VCASITVNHHILAITKSSRSRRLDYTVNIGIFALIKISTVVLKT